MSNETLPQDINDWIDGKIKIVPSSFNVEWGYGARDMYHHLSPRIKELEGEVGGLKNKLEKFSNDFKGV